MTHAPVLRVYLEGSMLETARAGSFNFLTVLRRAVEARGWRVEWHQTGTLARMAAPLRDGYALFHMEAPTHARALTFRRAYHYPFWQIEPVPQRWRFAVAQRHYDPTAVDPEPARAFAERLRARVLPGPPPRRGDTILVPLQGHIRRCRSFQTMSPVEMLKAIAATGRPTVATLHPRESYDEADRAALAELAARHPNLRIGGDTAQLLRDCAFVATQNSAVAFDGYLLGKPAVLFGQIDFHHIGLNVAELGAAQALARAESHAPDFDRYLFWFLQQNAINATLPDAEARILAAMRRGGWPIGAAPGT
ncbi:hypothetical protein ACDP63_06595 [Paracoccus sp. P2]|uniref:Capsular polysaccharide biosynthesis protein n=1 Tax=Paracoccus pantotrophus TaxID=82367 RepID=A0A7H9BYR4_PARPN|nr:hypothetical protein [Paracoccus pantotrophus]MDF3854461.1 hypothetical protein [Paracoccus pantotrophus]QLH16262.1 hypothetical protein HYQ43_19455 [Paracoccus pantotrophus]RDE02049.1 hypothetical protein DTW92_00540 [Paracoccus pantotrophus]RNI19344.1 hypothetical protein EB844_04780 [Paracoccus pantotrophus]WGR64289.1 hypothetical protein E3U24_02825 [Paracoccus pantotrophus]